MSVEENKAIVRRFLLAIWSKGNLAVIDEIFASNFVGYTSGKESERGPEGVKQRVATFRTAFPDLHFTVQDEIVEGEKVAVRWIGRATHKGEWMGIAPTNKQVTYTGMNIFRIAAGKLVEEWFNWDALGFMQQLGAVPSIGQGGK